MKIYYIEKGTSNEFKIEYPALILQKTTWDDYGYKTTFSAKYFWSNNDSFDLGRIKILHVIDMNTTLPNIGLERLPKDYCSIGESIDYYEKLNLLDEHTKLLILNVLNDVAFNEEIYSDFKDNIGFTSSLVRYGQTTLLSAQMMFQDRVYDKEFKFRYKRKLDGAIKAHEIEFNFSSIQGYDNRICAIIGKNATGKTKIIEFLANDLKSDMKTNIENFYGSKPDFEQIVYISYDVNEMNQENSNYDKLRYSSIETKNLSKGVNQYSQLYKSMKRIIELKRIDRWKEHVNNIIDINEADTTILYEIQDYDGLRNFIKKYSAGQKIILEVITTIVSEIKLNSILIYDEPELHLHPNAISKLMVAIIQILREFKSVCIIATHNPSIIQQLPRKNVIVFDREGNVPIIKPLACESLGEGLDKISNTVFETDSIFTNYKNILRHLAKKMSFNEVLDFFHCDLPLNSLIYLTSIYEVNNND